MKLAWAFLLPLLLVLLVSPAVVAQDDEDPPLSDEEKARLQKVGREWQELSRQAQEAFRMKEYEKAIGFYEKALALVKDEEHLSPTLARNSTYNTACCYGLLGNKEKCLEWLRKAVERGFRDSNHLKMDTDLEVVKSTPEFKAIIDGLTWNDEVTVVVPEGVEATRPLPVVVALHVERRDDAYVAEYLKALANEAKVLLVAPRAPFAHPDGGYAWKLNPTDDGPALKKIGQALEAAAKTHPFDPEKVTILGVGGRGGYLAYLLGLSEPTRYRRIVVLGGYFNKYLFPDFFEKAKVENRGVWILHGDELPQLANAKKAEEILQEAGFTVSFTEYEGKARPKDDQLDPVKEALRW
jgi:predicted esterase